MLFCICLGYALSVLDFPAMMGTGGNLAPSRIRGGSWLHEPAGQTQSLASTHSMVVAEKSGLLPSLLHGHCQELVRHFCEKVLGEKTSSGLT